MRAGPSVCLKPRGVTPVLVAGCVFVFTAGLGAPAWAADQAVPDQTDIELPAEVAPADAEAPVDDDVIEPDEELIQPKTLDRSFMRPDLKSGSEDAPPPRSVEESKQDKLDPTAEGLPLPTPIERPKVLGELYDQLSKATDAEAAVPITEAIENLWRSTGSATVDLLMSRTARFTKESDLDLALQIIDATVDMAPDEAEAWYLRGRVHYLQKQYELAIADFKRALEHDPKHYRALEDLGLVFDTLGTKKEALAAYRKALEVNPFLGDAHQAVEFLSREVGGRDI
jgi:tetratricopeptide (TPR) repeat protein